MPSNTLGQLGMQAATQATGGILGAVLGAANDQRQLNQQRRLQELQIKGNKELTDYNWNKQLEMWKATNYGAQVGELQKAGLNPGLLYGMSGGGATTSNISQGNVSGGNAPAGGREIQDMIGQGMQLQLLKAQKENIEADTANKQAETSKKTIETETGKVDLQFKKDSYEDNLDIIRGTFSKLQEEANKLNRENRIGDATIEEQKMKIKSEALGAFLTNELIRAQTNKTDQEIQQSKAQVQKWAQEIAQNWFNLDRQERELKLKTWEAEMKANYPGISQALGKMINDAVGEVEKLVVGDKADPINKAPETKK